MAAFPPKGGFFRRKRAAAPPSERGLWLAPTVLLTLLSSAAGIGLGSHIVHTLQANERPSPVLAPSAGDGTPSRLRRLKPIVTNIAEPADVWARLEASIVFQDEMPNADVLAARINEDLVGYLKTLKLAQFEGAGQFQHLREDLKDRVAIRSGGDVRDVIIESLVIQ